jgi:hypothetical protein
MAAPEDLVYVSSAMSYSKEAYGRILGVNTTKWINGCDRLVAIEVLDPKRIWVLIETPRGDLGWVPDFVERFGQRRLCQVVRRT